MIADLSTVVWKEWTCLFRQPGSRLRLGLAVFVPIAYFGIIAPLQAGPRFVTGAEPWFIAVVLPLLTVIMIAPDSFAGERERKTLRTLLASRLPDAAILWAKIGFAIVLGLALMSATLFLAVVVVNVFTDTEGLAMISAGPLLYMISVSLLLSAVAAGAAVLISLRAQTVQQAQQILAAVFFLIPNVLGLALIITSDNGESGPLVTLFDWVGSTTGRAIVLLVMFALAAILLTAARLGFRRTRLVS